MIEIFHFHNPENFYFAQAGSLGTWFPPGQKPCPECTVSRQRRVPPLILEWEPGSDVVGDFVWPGFDDEVVVNQRVRDALEGRFRGFEFKPIEMWQSPRLNRPKNPKRGKARVWLPYQGAPLWDLWVTAWCRLDIEKSGLILKKVCSTCGEKYYTNSSSENSPLVVDRSSWGGELIFHIDEYPRWIFCLQEVKEFIERAEFTNVAFLRDGFLP